MSRQPKLQGPDPRWRPSGVQARPVVLALGLAALIIWSPATAATAPAAAVTAPARPEGQGAAAREQLSPLVREVVELLEEGLSPSLVLEWLDRGAPDAQPLTSRDLLALKRAGATDELIRRMLGAADSAGKPSTGDADAPPAGGASGGRSMPEGESRLGLEIDYRAVEPLEGEQRLEGRDLFVYLGGRLVARVPSRGDLVRRETPLVELSVAPGEHTLRIARERHVERRDGAWRHESRVCPEAIALRLEPGSYWRLRLAWTESVFGGGNGTLRWDLSRDGAPVGEERRVETPKEGWPALCEDIEADAAGSRRSERSLERQLEGCVRWASLWDGAEDIPPRSDALDTIVSQTR